MLQLTLSRITETAQFRILARTMAVKAVTCLLLLCRCLAVDLCADDRVYPTQGATAGGEITSIKPDEVIISVRGKPQTYPMHEVQKITFNGEPSGLDRARDLVKSGQYDQAITELNNLPAPADASGLIAQDIAFYRLYSEGKKSLNGSGDLGNAIRGLIQLVSTNRNSHHLYEISELLGELAQAVGQMDKAKNYFAMLGRSSAMEIKGRGMWRVAELELQAGNLAEAKRLFSDLSQQKGGSESLIQLRSYAEVGLARCETSEGNTEGALKRLDALIGSSNSSNTPLYARISNARGECLEAMSKPELAVLSYLQTDLLFAAAPEQHAEALYHLAQLLPKIGEGSRGADARSRLTKLYPASSWAGKL